MVQSLEQYIAQATDAYKPASTAIQTQLGGLDSQLATANEQINRNYAQQQAQLESQRNQAAESASMQAAGSGGSFGGSANLANRKYYERSFVPAQTQLQTNQANDLAQARQSYENQRTNLNSQLAQLEAQAKQSALQQFWSAQEAEKQREAQLRAQAQANAASNSMNKYLMSAIKSAASNTAKNGLKNWDFGNGYSLQELPGGEAGYYKNGNIISQGDFLTGTGANGVNWDIWNDVWGNGVRTNGIGSDTVEAFNRYTPTDGKYSYLY